ncbi:hypothetical protein CVT26_015413 [Gymnopilus dilepis]|uniref:CxC1-like cysteine cluster associated with KDZ transposases domain-containing protein n=1 Tax=Gymnopilus dilepis TaxID=231916 RepID=A0A409YEF3_9AGAR|nr:hypothetical protein CVT26_015413 [Gymnopilus dilepis]
MAPKLVWRRPIGGQVEAKRTPGSIYEQQDAFTRQQRQMETPIYAPGGVFYQVPPVPLHKHSSQEMAKLDDEAQTDLLDAGLSDAEELAANADAQNRGNVSAAAYRKKERQNQQWNENIIPMMIRPYVTLLRETDSLRDMSSVRGRAVCSVCAFFYGFHYAMYADPSCSSDSKDTPLLLQRTCITASKSFPKSGTQHDCLSITFIVHQDTLRIRFSKALQWYSTLQDTKHLRLGELLDHVRETRCEPEPESVDHDDINSNPGLNNIRRPSEYLRQRCPLCFGGQNWYQPDELFDSIVCIDANFTQKRRRSQGHAPSVPHQHPETLFVPPDDVAAVQAEVEGARPVRPKATTHDAYEPGMKVPSSTLDECHESFTAADSNRVKASTQFFADTGLMALLCRHDRVLWLVNMTSAGEKQYYAICLLNKLFEHIPEKMRIGVLYDIGCQLHRSCVKYGFLASVLDRITFGISVFHAYGHQWPCQIIYHPRKCPGFGLSDGEGCERFWSAIKSLIPSLRVSGYYTRLYTIDTKVKHLDSLSLVAMGQWLRRKWRSTQEQKLETSNVLAALDKRGVTVARLRQEWANQIQEQTKPLPRQSKNLADKELHSILVLQENLRDYEAEIAALEDILITENFDPGTTVIEVQAQLQEKRKKIKIIQKSIEEKKAVLSIADQKNLKRLLGNKFLRIRINALAVKQRIRERLRHRKYELESFGTSYRNTVNHQKLQQHAEHQIKRKEPGIRNLASTYNKLCQDLSNLISSRTAPKGARAPPTISLEGLFNLDVDHDIWQDDLLTNDLDDPLAIPDWLGNDDIRAGIKVLLRHDRCLEEERRLLKERQSMQEWFIEEWNLVNFTLTCTENDQDIDLSYQLRQHKNQLLHLCLAWKEAVSNLPCSLSKSWGPTETELQEAEDYRSTEQAIRISQEEAMDTDNTGMETSLDADGHEYVSGNDGDDDGDSDDSDVQLSIGDCEEVEEAELIDAMEGFDLAKEFRQ